MLMKLRTIFLTTFLLLSTQTFASSVLLRSAIKAVEESVGTPVAQTLKILFKEGAPELTDVALNKIVKEYMDKIGSVVGKSGDSLKQADALKALQKLDADLPASDKRIFFSGKEENQISVLTRLSKIAEDSGMATSCRYCTFEGLTPDISIPKTAGVKTSVQRVAELSDNEVTKQIVDDLRGVKNSIKTSSGDTIKFSRKQAREFSASLSKVDRRLFALFLDLGRSGSAAHQKYFKAWFEFYTKTSSQGGRILRVDASFIADTKTWLIPTNHNYDDAIGHGFMNDFAAYLDSFKTNPFRKNLIDARRADPTDLDHIGMISKDMDNQVKEAEAKLANLADDADAELRALRQSDVDRKIEAKRALCSCGWGLSHCK